MKKKARSFSLILVTLILTLLMGMSVSAATKKTVAKIGNKKYTSLSAAVNNVKNGQTIRVTSGISTSDAVTIRKPKVKFTIDFGKQTYTSTSKDFAIRVESGEVTIKNARLTAKKGKILYVASGAKATIASGNYKSRMNFVKFGDNRNEQAIYNKGTLTIKNGKFTSDFDSKYNPFDVLYLLKNEGTMNIKGGTFKGDRFGLLENFSGKLTISNGNFTTTAPADNFRSWGPIDFKKGSIVMITGGTFVSPNVNLNSSANLTVTGGTFKCSFWGREDSRTSFGGKCKFEAESIGTWNGRITITGGTFTSSAVDRAMLYAGGPKAIITVKGGSFTGENAYLYEESNSGKVKFAGKRYVVNTKYNKKPSEY